LRSIVKCACIIVPRRIDPTELESRRVIPAFLIMLREGLEAALIVGIVSAYLVRIGRRDALPKVVVGIVAAVALSVAVGVIVVLTVERLPIAIQESIEGITALVAVAVLTWMLFWMRRQGRAIKGELEHDLNLALAGGSVVALVGLAFMSVAREGLETALLFIAVVFRGSASLGPGPAIGFVAGLAVAIAIGVAIFVAGVRVDLRRFFTWTGVLLIFVAAGLCAFAVGAFAEAGIIDKGAAVFDLGSLLPETSPLGTVLSGLFGYRAAPSALELAAYFGYLIPVLALFLRGDRPSTARAKPVDAETSRA
jgi:high-affinity iron transporter